jgi:hypothetical protein
MRAGGYRWPPLPRAGGALPPRQRLPTHADGRDYMEFVEAVGRAMEKNAGVELPQK